MTFHLMFVHIILVRFRLLSDHLLGKICSLGLPYVLFVFDYLYFLLLLFFLCFLCVFCFCFFCFFVLVLRAGFGFRLLLGIAHLLLSLSMGLWGTPKHV